MEENVKRLLMVSGKVYFDLAKARREKGLEKDVAIVRIEQVPRLTLPCSLALCPAPVLSIEAAGRIPVRGVICVHSAN